MHDSILPSTMVIMGQQSGAAQLHGQHTVWCFRQWGIRQSYQL